MKNILVMVGGGTKHLKPFIDAGKNLNLDVTTASFSDMELVCSKEGQKLTVNNEKISNFDVVYIRLVGKQFEKVSTLVSECRKHGIAVFDEYFTKGLSLKLPYPKSIEAKILSEVGVNVPKTYYAGLKMIIEKAPEVFGYPYVIKGTTGKQGHAVWSPKNYEHLKGLLPDIKKKGEKEKMDFIAQEFIKSSQRHRVFVVGNKVVAAITRPTRWRRRFIEKVNGEFPEGKREMTDISKDEKEMAVKAAKTLGITVAGVDVLIDDKTGKKYILEVNSAPRWDSVRKDTGIFVEDEILTYFKKAV